MSELKYGIFAEDEVFKSFLETIVPRVLTKITYNLSIGLDKKFSTDKVPKDGISKFLNTFNTAITEGCLELNDGGYGLNFCILGLDCDENGLEELEYTISTMLNESNQSNCAVICIARKSIEFWMWYCREEKSGNPITVNIYDSYNNQTMKSIIYNRKRSGKRGVIYAEKFANEVTVDYLHQKSSSFEAFFQAFKTFIDNRN